MKLDCNVLSRTINVLGIIPLRALVHFIRAFGHALLLVVIPLVPNNLALERRVNFPSLTCHCSICLIFIKILLFTLNTLIVLVLNIEMVPQTHNRKILSIKMKSKRTNIHIFRSVGISLKFSVVGGKIIRGGGRNHK